MDLPSDNLSDAVVGGMAEEVLGQLRACALIGHRGERGRGRENALRAYFRKLVPPGFDVGSGFVIDQTGRQSKQQDIVIYRRDYHPVFSVQGISLFMVEAVAAVIEVKSRLDARELRGALRNSASVKELDRTGGGANYIIVGGAGGQRQSNLVLNPANHDHQVFSMIVAGEASLPRSIIPVVQGHLTSTPRAHWPNMLVVADSWTLAYQLPEHMRGSLPRTNNMLAEQLRVSVKTDQGNVEPLIDAAEQLWSFLRVTPLIDVKPARYFHGSPNVSKTYPLFDAEPHVDTVKSTEAGDGVADEAETETPQRPGKTYTPSNLLEGPLARATDPTPMLEQFASTALEAEAADVPPFMLELEMQAHDVDAVIVEHEIQLHDKRMTIHSLRSHGIPSRGAMEDDLIEGAIELQRLYRLRQQIQIVQNSLVSRFNSLPPRERFAAIERATDG